MECTMDARNIFNYTPLVGQKGANFYRNEKNGHRMERRPTTAKKKANTGTVYCLRRLRWMSYFHVNRKAICTTVDDGWCEDAADKREPFKNGN